MCSIVSDVSIYTSSGTCPIGQYLQILNLVRQLDRKGGFIFYFPICEFVIDQKVLDEYLVGAIYDKSYGLVCILLKYGANPNYWPKNHIYPNHLGLGISYPMHLSLNLDYLDIVKWLHKSGASLVGCYPILRKEIIHGRVDSVKYLCDNDVSKYIPMEGIYSIVDLQILALRMCDEHVLDGTCIADRVISYKIFGYLSQIKSNYIIHKYFDIGDVFIGNLFTIDE